MELIKTKELYENDAFVIIEAEFEDSETKKRIQEIALGLKNNLGDITKIRTIHRKQILSKRTRRQSNAVTGSFFLFLFAPRYFHFQSAALCGKERQAFSSGGKSTGVPVKVRSVISFST